jgi:hypothetical protein
MIHQLRRSLALDAYDAAIGVIMIGIEPDDSPALDSCNGGAMRRAKRTVAAHEMFRLPRFSYVVHAHSGAKDSNRSSAVLSLSVPSQQPGKLI